MPNQARRDLGALVRAAMAREGLSARELGRRTDISHSSISRKLSGEIAWADEDLEAMAEHLGVEGEELAEWLRLAKRTRGGRWGAGDGEADETPPGAAVWQPATASARTQPWRRGSDVVGDLPGTDGDAMLEIRGASMAPEMYDGDQVRARRISPGTDLRHHDGDLVACRYRNRDGELVTVAGRIEVMGSSTVRIMHVSPSAPAHRIPMGDIDAIALIVGLCRRYEPAAEA